MEKLRRVIRRKDVLAFPVARDGILEFSPFVIDTVQRWNGINRRVSPHRNYDNAMIPFRANTMDIRDEKQDGA